MNYEILYPEREPESKSRVYIARPIIEEGKLETLVPKKQIARDTVFVNWLTERASEGVWIYRLGLHQETPRRIVSPIIDAANTGSMDDEWAVNAEKMIKIMKMQEGALAVDIREPMQTFVNRILERVSLDSAELLLNHSRGVYSQVFDDDLPESYVVAVDMRNKERKYDVWNLEDEEYLGEKKWEIEKLVDSIDDWEYEEIKFPL